MTTFFRKPLLLIVALLMLSSNLKASHLLGGEIVWRCQPNGTYVFTMTLYRDCGGILLPYQPQTLQNNAGVTITMDSINSEYILPYCYSNTTPSCSGANSGEGYMEKVTFQSGEITLHGAPPPGGWYFSWSSCCRPSTVTNITNPGSQGYHLRAYMYPFVAPGGTSALSAGDTVSGIATCYDSSPYFLEGPQARACANESNTLINNLGLDTDLDSLYYRFAEPKIDSANSVPWATGYSANSPLPDSTGAVPAQIDSLTGVITFNSNMVGSWATCVEVESWRNNQMVGKVFRDIPIFTLNCVLNTGLCATTAEAAPPSLEIINDSGSKPMNIIQSLAGDTLFYKIYANPGDLISFKLKAEDLTPHENCQSETLSMLAFGATLSDSLNYSSTSSCLLSSPCATLSSSGINGAFSASDSLDVDFEWTVTTAHLNPVVLGTVAPAIYPFYFKVTDDECPVNKSTSIIVVIEVQDAVSEAPDVQTSCIAIDSNGFATIDWIPNPDTANWGAYVIYAVDSSLNTTALDTLYNWGTSDFVDSTLSSTTIGYIIATTNSGFTSWKYSQPILSMISTTVAFNGTSFMAMPGFNYYQWMLCDTTGYTTIPNANSNIFTPTNTGDYAVLIINGNCTVITDCLSFNSPFGLDEENAPSLYCYPNPNTSRKLFFSVSEVEVSITDLSGRVLLEKQRINQTSASLDLSDLPAGVYLVQAEYSGEKLTSTIILQ